MNCNLPSTCPMIFKCSLTQMTRSPEAEHPWSWWETSQFEIFLGRREGPWQMGHPTTLEHLGEIMGGTFYKHETTRSYAAIKPRKETAYSFGILCGVGTGLTLKRTASLTFGKSVSCENQFQDWEDSHGEVRKKVLQQVLLPHEIVGNFAAIGESYRMIGHTVPCQKISAMQPLPSKFGGCVCFPPKRNKILFQGPRTVLANGTCH